MVSDSHPAHIMQGAAFDRLFHLYLLPSRNPVSVLPPIVVPYKVDKAVADVG